MKNLNELIEKLDKLEGASELPPRDFSDPPKELLREESNRHDINLLYFQSYEQDIKERNTLVEYLH
ncbi:MAG: hypothetical protein MI921_15835 [Cytophagales bacterium]|nr:hypothetical protein [Cytophagales bacterium]